MAKVTYSALISDIRGRLRQDVFTIFRGTHIIRTYCANPHNPRTARQQFVRGHWSNLSGCWWHLPEAYQFLWNKYGSRKQGTKSGLGAFMQANMRLLAADHPELVRVDHPPPTPSTPMALQNFNWSYAGASLARITWNNPLDSETFVQFFHRLNWDYSPSYNVYWRQTATVRSDCGQYDWLHPYPTGTDLFIRSKTIDKWGRTSPFTHRIKIVVP